MSNCVAVAKDTIWQRLSIDFAPAAAALTFACALACVTVWFTGGALGPIIGLAGLVAALASLAVTSTKSRALLFPMALAIGGIGLSLLAGGGLFTASITALLWPLLGVLAAGERAVTAITASISATLVLLVTAHIVGLPGSEALSQQSGIFAFGVCAAFAVAGIVRQRTTKPGDQAKLAEAIAARDIAVTESELARAQSKSRSQFMAEMSHEIRTPLNAILGFADTMREGVFGPLPQPYADYPGLIHSSGTHLLDLVSDLLDLSKIEAGRYNPQLKPIRLDEMAHEGIRVSVGAAGSAGVQLRHEASGPVEVLADARAMRQIIYNLMSNAIKFTPNHGRITLRTVVDDTAKVASLEIEDTGMGMSSADLARIGEPWNQSQQDTGSFPQKTRGSGLGLALVKRLSELQNGSFKVESTLGIGTRAIVTLPLAQNDLAIMPQASS